MYDLFEITFGKIDLTNGPGPGPQGLRARAQAGTASFGSTLSHQSRMLEASRGEVEGLGRGSIGVGGR